MAKMTAAQRKKIDDEIRAQNAKRKAEANKRNANRKALNSKTSKGYVAPKKKPTPKPKAKAKKTGNTVTTHAGGTALLAREKIKGLIGKRRKK